MAERTEPATARRRDEARRKGQVAKSTELNSAIMLMASVAFLAATGNGFLEPFLALMRRTFNVLLLADLSTGTLQGRPFDLAAEVSNLVAAVALVVLPFMIVLLVVGVVANVVQVGLRFTPAALAPSLGRLNPLHGFSRLMSKRGLVELSKATVKLVIVGYVAYGIFSGYYGILIRVDELDLIGGFGSLGTVATDLGKNTSGWLLALAAVDFVWQRRSFEQSLRMTKQDVTDELKQQEVAPQVRATLRRKQRQFAMTRMMAAVPKSDVVVTNPTHFAVALYYDPRKMAAPTVCAKGQRLIAHQIAKIARENRVPIVQNPPLARALFHNVEIGMPVPPTLYRAVAEVLAFVYRLKQERSHVR